jgi:hypothetical protein
MLWNMLFGALFERLEAQLGWTRTPWVRSLHAIGFEGIGSDFDGGGGILGCQASNELINITKELLRRGYSHDDIRKIWGGNLLRVMRQVEANAQV